MLGSTWNPDIPTNIHYFDHAKRATIFKAFCNFLPSFSRKEFAFSAVRNPLFWSLLTCLPLPWTCDFITYFPWRCTTRFPSLKLISGHLYLQVTFRCTSITPCQITHSRIFLSNHPVPLTASGNRSQPFSRTQTKLFVPKWERRASRWLHDRLL